mmetsp:Transcript_40642/g.106825  ORF Transcript_40642/g.106825 Transcript_40642/m.106825 type:complete len:259 (+) Transcript_40642:57-833(+)
MEQSSSAFVTMNPDDVPRVEAVKPGKRQAFGKWVRTARGSVQLAVRGCVGIGQGILDVLLLSNEVDLPHVPFVLVAHFCSTLSFFHQWRSGDPKMFLVRAGASLLRVGVQFHTAVCGRTWPADGCDLDGWSDIRLPLRIAACAAGSQLIGNALWLILHYLYPASGVTATTGCRFLWWRGVWRIILCVINLFRGSYKIDVYLTSTTVYRGPVEISVNFLRGGMLTPVAVWSLLRQYQTTGTGVVVAQDAHGISLPPGEL